MRSDSSAIGAKWLTEADTAGACVGDVRGKAAGSAGDGPSSSLDAEWVELIEARASRSSAAASEEDELSGGCGLLSTDRLRGTLLRGGIPARLRVRAWLTFSGAAAHMAEHPGAYARLHPRIAAAASCSDENARAVLAQIEKDLLRTNVRTARAGAVHRAGET
eukprot:scaffold36010_cov101-Isochrysis_galbana.AAC.1